MKVINTTAYKFISLDKLVQLREHLRTLGQELSLKGTILLSQEGLNLMLSGLEANMQIFKSNMLADQRFSDLVFKDSSSEYQPFEKLVVKIRPEIITFKQNDIRPEQHTVSHLDPDTFRQWLENERDITVLDTRNQFELAFGKFVTAIDLKIDNFSDFAEAAKSLDPELKRKPMVIYCTGGVRCEKAGPFLESLGFEEVYQLDGGILNYFDKCAGAHYQGNCFVFDDRIAIDPQLREVSQNPQS